jgi:hypothetical protein
MLNFFLCPELQFYNLKEPLLQLHVQNILTTCVSIAACLDIISNRNFFQQSTSSSSQLCKALLCNCISALPQSSVEVWTKKVVELQLQTFKIGLPHFCDSELDQESDSLWIQNYLIKGSWIQIRK